VRYSAAQHASIAAAYDQAARDPAVPALKRLDHARKREWFTQLSKLAAQQAAPPSPESSPGQSPEPTYAQSTPNFPIVGGNE